MIASLSGRLSMVLPAWSSVDRFRLCLILAIAASLSTPGAEAQQSWTRTASQPGEHIAYVQVEAGVRLEVVDWGGAGRPLVFLAGLGNTAHVFDAFAPRFADAFHVLGITRRGFGASSAPPAGYEVSRLAADIVVVLDSLGLEGPIVVGHSIAGEELTALGVTHGPRVAALVYLDAGFDYTLPDVALARAIPRPPAPQPSSADLRSLATLTDWVHRYQSPYLPQHEVMQQVIIAEDGSVLRRGASGARNKVAAGVRARDYASVRVPVLAFVANTVAPPIVRVFPSYESMSDSAKAVARRAFAALYPGGVGRRGLGILERMRTELPNGTLVDMEDAGHYVFLDDPEKVERAIRGFVAALP